MTDEDVQKMAEALDEIPGPVFAYCRSGARSTNIYLAASERQRLGRTDVSGTAAGSAFLQRLQHDAVFTCCTESCGSSTSLTKRDSAFRSGVTTFRK